MNSIFGKLAIVLLIVIAYLIYAGNKQDKANQQQLQQELSTLKQQTVNQDRLIEQQKQQVDKLGKQQLEQMSKQVEESKKQNEKLNQQIETMDNVVEDLKQKQKIEQEIMDKAQIDRQGVLNGTYIAQGLQMASTLKIHVAEYTMSSGRFPKNNRELQIASPKNFASEAIKEIWVTKGKITIVYTEKSGINKGIVNLTPEIKNNQIQWSCSTPDFKTISRYMPQCEYQP